MFPKDTGDNFLERNRTIKSRQAFTVIPFKLFRSGKPRTVDETDQIKSENNEREDL